MKSKIFFLSVLLFFYIFRYPIMNLLLIADGTRNSGYIPNESSIFTFFVTKIDEGSGMYWRYGEDNNNYYYFSLDEENVYFYINKSPNCPNFDKLNFKTWCSATKVKQK